MFEDANEVFEILRGGLPFYMIIFLPILILMSPINPVFGAHDFAAYRMQQFDLQGNARGCRNSLFNLEARTIESGSYGRKCVLAPVLQLTPSRYREIISQGAAGLLIIMPSDISKLGIEDRQTIMELERFVTTEETSIPVYFAIETPELLTMYHNIINTKGADSSASLFKSFADSVSSTGYQMVASTSQAKPMNDLQIANIQGKLAGYGVEEQLPTIAIVAHYDAFGIAPALSFGSDSNGSGVAVLMELARLFSKLYSNSRTHARVNLLFLLSGAGKFNYQGTKKWIEDNIDSTESSLLQDSAYTLCLDSLGRGNTLNLHVSKPPKDGSAGGIFLQELKKTVEKFHPEVKFNMIHKKINLADEMLSWEHERFSIRRLPAFTLSRFSSPRDLERTTVLDTRNGIDGKSLARNVKIIAEALARYVYNLTNVPDVNIFTESLVVKEEYLLAWVEHLSSSARGAQLLADSMKNPVVMSLDQAMSRYLKEVRVTYTKPDKRDPEFAFYDMLSTTMTAYGVKPAAFDLLLMGLVSAYLFVLYLVMEFFPQVYSLMNSYGARRMKHS